MSRTPDGCTIRAIVKIGGSPQTLLMRLLDAELLSRSSVVSGKLVVVCDPAETVFRFIDKGSAHLIVRSGGERFARDELGRKLSGDRHGHLDRFVLQPGLDLGQSEIGRAHV